MVKFIIFLIRHRLGLKKGERFQFTNQKSPFDEYYFATTKLMKRCISKSGVFERPAHVQLNYLLSDECKIQKVETLTRC